MWKMWKNLEIHKMICYHCGYEWEYKGKHPFYACCPKCMKKVSLKKAVRLMGEKEEHP